MNFSSFSKRIFYNAFKGGQSCTRAACTRIFVITPVYSTFPHAKNSLPMQLWSLKVPNQCFYVNSKSYSHVILISSRLAMLAISMMREYLTWSVSMSRDMSKSWRRVIQLEVSRKKLLIAINTVKESLWKKVHQALFLCKVFHASGAILQFAFRPHLDKCHRMITNTPCLLSRFRQYRSFGIIYHIHFLGKCPF